MNCYVDYFIFEACNKFVIDEEGFCHAENFNRPFLLLHAFAED